MKIKIRSASHKLSLWLPSCLIFNPITATLAGSKIIHKIFDGEGEKTISPKACRALFREINRCRRKHKKWTLVDVRASDGTEVNVRL